MNDTRVNSFRFSDYERYDGIHEKYVETIGKSEKSDKVNEIVLEKNAKIIDDIVYEEYENAHEEYTPRYASYSNDEKSKIQVISKKLGKKGKFIISIILFLFIVALLLGVYFGFQDYSNFEELLTESPVNTTDISTTDIPTTETNKTNSCMTWTATS